MNKLTIGEWIWAITLLIMFGCAIYSYIGDGLYLMAIGLPIAFVWIYIDGKEKEALDKKLRDNPQGTRLWL